MEKDAVRLNILFCGCLIDSNNRRQPRSVNLSYIHVSLSNTRRIKRKSKEIGGNRTGRGNWSGLEEIEETVKEINGNRRKSNGEGEIGVIQRESRKLYDNRKNSMGIGLYEGMECRGHQNRWNSI